MDSVKEDKATHRERTSPLVEQIRKNQENISALMKEHSKTNSKSLSKRDRTAGNDSAIEKPDLSIEWKKEGVRSSFMSDYSGVIQHVDIDTIKYVNADVEDNELSKSGLYNTTLPKSASLHSLVESSEVPKRSSRRTAASIDSAKISRMTSSPLLRYPSHSPDKSSPPPKSNLPTVSVEPFSPVKNVASPSKKRNSSLSSRSSANSMKLNDQLDGLIREANELKKSIKVGETRLSPSNSSVAKTTNNRLSVTSSVGMESFHTAESTNGKIILESGSEGEDLDDYTADLERHEPELSLLASHTKETVESKKAVSPALKDAVVRGEEANEVSNETKSKKQARHARHSTRRSSHHHHNCCKSSNRHSTQSGTSSKRLSSSIKPFSYDTLSRLLNATDGIVIGQEFASLNIPMEEKFLIERVVDSISRLTANMILNPVRYDQSLVRLEKVLNILEGFE